ncbi:MAG: ATP-binding protein [Candidatus Staskawiczbacteria bacterium]|nr:ATP-binding protein [Candidatus Staskawiczbacteria bacterium]
MIYERKQDIQSNLYSGRVLVIYGPRRVGKTTLLQSYLNAHSSKKIFFTTGDDITIRQLFLSENRTDLLDFADPFEIIAIDEAQNIKSIGLGIKMIIDAFPHKIIILTGSSSFNLSRDIGEPLTGRHFTLTLLPVAQREIGVSRFELKNKLEDFLIHGSYPEVLNTSDKLLKIKILTELVSSYLFKDILALDKIKSPDLLLDITKCLAFQIGNEVSFNEIAKNVKSDVKTVQRYIDVLEKMFVIRKVRGFSRNLRNEISKKSKFYFYDNGIRNAVISQFNALDSRNDIGQLWENFIFGELIKKSGIEQSLDTFYFWRTHTGQEIDIIKENAGELFPIECKWSKETAPDPSLWKAHYKNTKIEIVNKNNYLDFLIK